MTVIITGANGQLGSEFCRQLGADAFGLDLPEFDLTDPEMVRQVLQDRQPSAVINCAAYTQVDQAEKEPETCRLVNASAVGFLADACNDTGCTLVQISTDYVFGADADRRTPYVETDLPGPQGIYARTKLEGEREAARADSHIIARTCGLYGITDRNNNFVEAMLRLGQERDQLQIVNDQHCTPSFVAHVARAILFLLESRQQGIFHVVNGGQTTWLEFAREIFRHTETSITLEAITTEQYGAPAPRPRYSVLDTGKYKDLGGPELPAWQEGLSEYLARRHSR